MWVCACLRAWVGAGFGNGGLDGLATMYPGVDEDAAQEAVEDLRDHMDTVLHRMFLEEHAIQCALCLAGKTTRLPRPFRFAFTSPREF